MALIQRIALVLVIIGAVNWGLIAVFNFNLVSMLFGADSLLANIIYGLVGISGILAIGMLFQPIPATEK
ncbi:MAG: DUF378 domain-containing protein [Bacilli bacterium]